MHDYANGAMAAQVAMNTTLSAATGGITVFILAYLITRKYDVGGLCNGILAGVGKGWRKMENVFFFKAKILYIYIIMYTYMYCVYISSATGAWFISRSSAVASWDYQTPICS